MKLPNKVSSHNLGPSLFPVYVQLYSHKNRGDRGLTEPGGSQGENPSVFKILTRGKERNTSLELGVTEPSSLEETVVGPLTPTTEPTNEDESLFGLLLAEGRKTPFSLFTLVLLPQERFLGQGPGPDEVSHRRGLRSGSSSHSVSSSPPVGGVRMTTNLPQGREFSLSSPPRFGEEDRLCPEPFLSWVGLGDTVPKPDLRVSDPGSSEQMEPPK